MATRKANRQWVATIKCKILLPEFNTWKQVLLERKNGFEVPLGNAFSLFSTTFSCLFGQMSSALRRKADAITA